MKGRWFLAGLGAAIVAPAIVVILVLAAAPQIRHASFRMAMELPQTITYFLIRKPVISRDFAGAAKWLGIQLSLSQKLGRGTTTLIPGIVSNTSYVVARAKFPDDFAALRPFLGRLVSDQPDIFRPRIWLARSLLDDDPKAAFAHLEHAAKLTPSDDRSYRLAIEAALLLGQDDVVKSWCERYQTAQLGGLHHHEYNTLFDGVGLRKLALEVREAGGEPVLIGNQGVELGKARDYDFTLPEPMSPKLLRLHLGVVRGISAHLEGLKVFSAGRALGITLRDVVVTSEEGFVEQESRVLALGQDGESVTLHHKDATPWGKMDRVIVRLRFERLGLASLSACTVKGG
jgi:hypothetical protein